jgi:hypothetical protein
MSFKLSTHVLFLTTAEQLLATMWIFLNAFGPLSAFSDTAGHLPSLAHHRCANAAECTPFHRFYSGFHLDVA